MMDYISLNQYRAQYSNCRIIGWETSNIYYHFIKPACYFPNFLFLEFQIRNIRTVAHFNPRTIQFVTAYFVL
jgi:hypothetical protein